MKTIVIIALAACATAIGCDQKPTEDKTKSAQADNTDKNERDRSADTKTPVDQKENEVDLGITKTIREDLVKNEALSMDAKNVKVVTADGVVTLRGPVKTDQEKTDIAKVASSVAGVKRVDNQLEVKTN